MVGTLSVIIRRLLVTRSPEGRLHPQDDVLLDSTLRAEPAHIPTKYHFRSPQGTANAALGGGSGIASSGGDGYLLLLKQDIVRTEACLYRGPGESGLGLRERDAVTMK